MRKKARKIRSETIKKILVLFSKRDILVYNLFSEHLNKLKKITERSEIWISEIINSFNAN